MPAVEQRTERWETCCPYLILYFQIEERSALKFSDGAGVAHFDFQFTGTRFLMKNLGKLLMYFLDNILLDLMLEMLGCFMRELSQLLYKTRKIK